MIDSPTRTIVDEMRPADAYQLGFTDALDSLEAGADGQASLQAARLAKRLDAILDRAERIAPWADVETVSEQAAEYAANEQPFDQEKP